MNWRATVAISVLVGLGSGVVCAKEYRARLVARTAAAFEGVLDHGSNAVSLSSIPVDPPERRAMRHDPAMELLGTNPYEGQLSGYRAALNIDGEHPLLEDPYADAMRFTNPYEHTVGIANPYVDALRESEMQRQARLDNPYTARLRSDTVNLENPYTRRH